MLEQWLFKILFIETRKIAESLGLDLSTTDLEQQIRHPLNKMQRTIKKKLASKIGLNINRNDIIQTLRWSGIGTKEYGYAINPLTVVLKK